MNIIFFDGHCGLCNGFVDFMMKIDPKGSFKFSPLQSECAKSHVSASDIEDLKSIVVLIDGKVYRKAKAVMMAVSTIGGIWKASLLLNFFPDKILNAGYDLVAKNRYKLFGKSETCRLPTAEEKSRFIL